MIVETLKEVIQSITSHKMRLAVTAGSVVWAVFLLIFLIGTGRGIEHSVSDIVGLDTLCVFTVKPGMSQNPWMGKGRHMNELKDDDIDFLIEALGNKVRSVEAICEGPVDNVTYGANHITGQLVGVTPDYLSTQSYYINRGEDISPIAMQRHEKVCLISETMCRVLIPEEENPVGCKLLIGNQAFTIVGIYKHKIIKILPPCVYVPFKTAVDCFNPEKRVNTMYVICNERITDESEANTFANHLQQFVNKKHGFAPEDNSATQSQCMSLRSIMIQNSMRYLQLFIWFICLSSLLVGISGISNIMLVAVKERTKEFAVRKVMGASDMSIVWLVLLETVVITMMFGYAGLLSGLGLLKLIGMVLETFAGTTLLSHSSIKLTYILIVLLVLVVSGVMAGIFPAVKAFRMKPIEALNS